ncbi:MAG: hypothetical protein HDT47_00210 [Ruminococcaceae bacterium]|nr:hypothetical protein [Oscillospiraceae bacterium]
MSTGEALPKEANVKKIKNIFNKVWEIFKGLIIAVAAVVLIGDTVVLYMLCNYVTSRDSIIELNMPYYMQTQDHLDLVAMYEKAPDSPEYKAMLKAFNTKYSVPYKNSQAYMDLAKAYTENPNSEEYERLLEKFLEEFDIPIENISFEESPF